jgi:hypothetical protein
MPLPPMKQKASQSSPALSCGCSRRSAALPELPPGGQMANAQFANATSYFALAINPVSRNIQAAFQASSPKLPGPRPVTTGLFWARSAGVHSCRCKSFRELVTASEVKHNCERATCRTEEAWSKAAGRCAASYRKPPQYLERMPGWCDGGETMRGPPRD